MILLTISIYLVLLNVHSCDIEIPFDHVMLLIPVY